MIRAILKRLSGETKQRDQFAGLAMQMLLQTTVSLDSVKDVKTGEKVGEYIARKAYVMADMMMAERAR